MTPDMPGNGSAGLPPAGEITDLLVAWRAGDPDAMERLMPLVYGALRRLAEGRLRGQEGGHTLTPTALLHEAWLRLVDHTRTDVRDRGHFLAVASRAMRSVLVDHARRRLAGKRTPHPPDPLDPVGAAGDEWALTTIALDDALGGLARVDERLYRVVECRFFGGLTEEETAEVLGVTSRTVHRDWLRARAWLKVAMGD
jgi:RNA polymerase sigma factor (TIGR02999 family)